MDADQLTAFKRALRDAAPPDEMADLQAGERLSPDVDMALSLARAVSVRLSLINDADHEALRDTRIFAADLAKRVKPVAQRIAELRHDGRESEAKAWESLVMWLAEIAAQVLEATIGGTNGDGIRA